MMITNVLVQICREVNDDVYLCVLDYSKAFDCVQPAKFINILTEIGLELYETCAGDKLPKS